MLLSFGNKFWCTTMRSRRLRSLGLIWIATVILIYKLFTIHVQIYLYLSKSSSFTNQNGYVRNQFSVSSNQNGYTRNKHSYFSYQDGHLQRKSPVIQNKNRTSNSVSTPLVCMDMIR